MSSTVLVCGVDEVGRGAFAGPVCAAAVSFWVRGGVTESITKSPIPFLRDSKMMTKKAMEDLRPLIWKEAHEVGFGESSVEEINDLGIDAANMAACARAVQDLKEFPQVILMDGNLPIPTFSKSHQLWTPKADDLWWPVSAASVIAKLRRDMHMRDLGIHDFPQYGWEKNSGYGTKDHIQAIKQYGLTPHHRTVFIRGYVK